MTNPSQERAQHLVESWMTANEPITPDEVPVKAYLDLIQRAAAEFEELERAARLDEVRKAPWVGSMTFDHWKTKRIAELERKLP